MAHPPATPLPETMEELGTLSGDELGARVILYNCDCHTYQQVIDLLCRAVPQMTPSRAFELAYRIDHTGSAVVYEGSLAICERAASILAGGGLRVVVQ
ncbi:MAG: ATP-dependent Clp protease adaptor ClpS [Nitrospirales bacterium]|nr:ATP-dependent Clp protease adaptor ClpS [Nitrospirales bacterium]